MAGDSKHGPTEVARILYKEIVPGDLRKIEAESNDSDTGGGARDFRFGSFKKLLPVIQHMFPRVDIEPRKRDGKIQDLEVYKGTFHWYDRTSGEILRKESAFESPTDARPSEGRIPCVHEYSCFDVSLIPRGTESNRPLVLFIQLVDGTVWPYYAEERSIRNPGEWDPSVAAEIIRCLDGARPAGRAAIGYCDFQTGERYSNGK